MTTYEQAKAQSINSHHPDQIQWNRESSYRNNPYRQLHHQNGIMGHIQVRLIAARNLKRSDWSALALGPVKHLGLSHAHGDVSSYAVFHVSTASSSRWRGSEDDGSCSDGGGGGENTPLSSSCSSSSIMDGSPPRGGNDNHSNNNNNNNMETFESSVVPNNNNPTWTTTSSNSSSFSIPLHKKSVQQQQHDGSGSSSSCTVMLHVNMKEDESAVDSFLPSPIRGGRMGLGQACLDINPLLFGEEGVMDVWLNLDAPQAAAASASASSFDEYSNDVPNNDIDDEGEYGKVRLLIAYEPHGFRPCKDDIVCMEAFARSNTNLILNPVAQPMKVLDTKGDYLLVQYHLPPDTNNATTSTNQTTTTTRRRRRRSVGTLRLHRNTLFVIERFTLVDGIWDLTMKPVDMIGSLGVVRWAGGVMGPYASAVMDLAMPAILSSKLLFAAAKTAGSAGVVGIITATKVASAAAFRKRDGGDGVYDDRSSSSSSSSRGVL